MEVERRGELPNRKEFQLLYERKNVPLAIDGAVKHWPANVKWNPADNGLDHLKVLAGDCIVQGMVSHEGSAFYGDIRAHQRITLPFREFIDSVQRVNTERQAYLAQVPIYTSDKGGSALSVLGEDISVPECLEEGSVCNVNFWMSCSASRSSIHYDPYHNLLCVVAGRKEVRLWPPSAGPYLYPLPLHGEASNHSGVDFVRPDYNRFPRFKEAMKHAHVVILKRSDALFIPEGWFHQVDSDPVTIAVNYWWPSKVSLEFGGHMDGYYLRRILSSLVDAEKEVMLGTIKRCTNPKTLSKNDELEPPSLEDLTPMEASQLETLVSQITSIMQNKQAAGLEVHEEDRIQQLLSITELTSLRRMLLVMVDKFPRTLEALILHGLSPATAELLTRKFEEMDNMFSEAAQSQFYAHFYSVFDDPQVAMEAFLDGKESFASLALNNVMKKFLGSIY